jgi:hypothetical protein
MDFSSLSFVADGIKRPYFTQSFTHQLIAGAEHASQESNLEPAALETAALPIELLAYVNEKRKVKNAKRNALPFFAFRFSFFVTSS